ncbi:tetratricopeptide repeat protein [Streptomyces sp. AP-93]|uniref:tetratricopeptide repeat protein n=1 Tax=Streptomyces sp. AP-93 TaxID=2929048 RepID=UPI001FB0017A|nr:tetratricopeptide repeat protein [Streptomyces sp. AP-93]MCJ0874115.1 tetratricopeptide repeat protein [Streptomyces sp. AP-93]
MRNLWFRCGLWVKFAVLAVMGSAAALIAGFWLPAAQAGVTGAVFLALCGGAAARNESALSDRRHERERAATSLLVKDLRGGLPRVREVRDPVLVGIHPYQHEDGDGDYTESHWNTPPYIPRDIEADLHAAVRSGGFVLLVGESTAGKTRSAFEAARLLMPDRFLLSPRNRDGIPSLIGALNLQRPYMIWLDDLERFLGPGGLTSSALSRMLASGSTIVATLRTPEYDRFGDHAEAVVDSADYEVWRDGRDVLRQAKKIRIPRQWSPAERERARFHRSDRRISRALSASEVFGVAEVLAAGPELLEAWKNAWSPGAHPRGAALVMAAVDVRRAGMHEAVPVSLLERLHEVYLGNRGGAQLRPEALDAALAWTLRPLGHTGASMLVGEPATGLRAFDYFLDTLNLEVIPDESWDLILTQASPRDALDMGMTALLDARHDRAERAFAVAAGAGLAAADVAKAVVLGKTGRIDQAVDELRTIWESRTRSLGREARDTLDAHAKLAYLTLKQGRPAEALALMRELLPLREAHLGENHPETLDTRLQIANAVGRLGRPAEAADQCRALLGRFQRELGPDHINTLDVEARIAMWTGKSGRYAEALALTGELVGRRTSCLGADHADTLYARGRQVAWLAAVGLHEEALERARTLLDDRKRVLGPDHLHTLHARRQVARSAERAEGPDAALPVWRETLEEHVRILGAGHRLTRKVVEFSGFRVG